MTAFESADDILAHYGVPGMKWGVRRRSGSSSTAKAKPSWAKSPPNRDEPKTPEPKGRLLKRKVKKEKVLSEDAIAFRAIRAKAKEQGVESLSNVEIKRVTERMNLQMNYAKAFPKKKNPLVNLFVEGALSDFGEETITGYVGGPQPRSAAKAQKVATIATALTVAREVRKITKK